jgi:hypothetical protein
VLLALWVVALLVLVLVVGPACDTVIHLLCCRSRCWL